MSRSTWSAEDWERLPPDPDPCSDFGYDPLELDVVRAVDGSDRRILLPQDEDLLADDAFIVATREAIVDLVDHV